MRKEKLEQCGDQEVAKKITIERVWQSQLRALESLESSIISLEKATKELKENIASKKLNHNYSINSDCMTYATRVWQNCLRLYELRKLQWELEGKDQNGKVIRETKKELKKKSKNESKKQSKKKSDVEV